MEGTIRKVVTIDLNMQFEQPFPKIGLKKKLFRALNHDYFV